MESSPMTLRWMTRTSSPANILLIDVKLKMLTLKMVNFTQTNLIDCPQIKQRFPIANTFLQALLVEQGLTVC